MGARRCFCLTERLGDCIIGTIAFRKLQQVTGEEWAWASKKEYASVAREFTNEIVELPKSEPKFVRSLLNGLYSEVRYVTPWWYWGEWGGGDIFLLDLIAKKAQIKLEPHERQVVLTPNQEDIAIVDKLLGGLKDYVVIFGSPHYSGWGGADWPFPERIKLVNELQAMGYKVVVIGGHDTKDIGGINLGNKTTIHQSVEVVKRARLFVGQTSSGAWIAAAAHNTPKIIMVDLRKIQARGGPKPGKEGHETCLCDKNIVDLDMRDPIERILEVVNKRGWL